MKMIVLAGAANWLLIHDTAWADGVAPSPPVLWSTLHVNDTLEEAAGKLSALPDVKKVKAKAAKPGTEPTLTIDYVAGGVPILGDRFAIDPSFVGSRLRKIRLLASDDCETGAYDRYQKLMEVLQDKYPTIALDGMGVLAKSAFIEASLSALRGQPKRIGSAFTNGDIVAYVTINFMHINPPSASYGYTEINRALSNINWSFYKARAQACGGTGVDRAALSISYIPLDDFKSAVGAINAQSADDKAAAAMRL